MKISQLGSEPQVSGGEWVSFPGGELEGKRPRALCPACRSSLQRGPTSNNEQKRRLGRAICFQCYRTELERARALRDAGSINTATETRFQETLPFEPVNRERLARLRAQRLSVRAIEGAGEGGFASRIRQAQIAARRTLQRAVSADVAWEHASTDRRRMVAAAIRAAEMQLPDSWLPFVVSR